MATGVHRSRRSCQLGRAGLQPAPRVLDRRTSFSNAVEPCANITQSQLTPVVLASPVPIVLDHFGGLRTASLHRFLNPDDASPFNVLEQPGLDAIKALLASGKLYLKLSAPYRVSEDSPSYDDMKPLVQALVKANPERVLYGSDWPHTQPFHRRPKHIKVEDTEPFVEFDDRAWALKLKSWVSEEEFQLLMVDNPRRLLSYTAVN